MKLIETAIPAIHYDADEHNFVVWDETYTEEVARTYTFADAKSVSEAYAAYLYTGDGTVLQNLCAVVDGKDVSLIDICANLAKARKLNDELRDNTEVNSVWHKHETIDDILHKILD